MILGLSYVKSIVLSGNLKEDVVKFLCDNRKERTAEHCIKVADTCTTLARRFNLDEDVSYTSGILHDISSVILPADMLCYAQNNERYIDESEIKYNFLLHQRISAVIAKECYGINDAVILSAIECHTTLRANASEYDMVLFLADKLSWDQDGKPPFYDVLMTALDVSLEFASLTYINFMLDNNMILLPHKWLKEAKEWLENTCI